VRDRDAGERRRIALRDARVGRARLREALPRSTVMNALSGLPTPSMRSRKWLVSSTLEISFARSFFDNAASVSLCTLFPIPDS
jgi:hypothetical protein